MGVFSGIKKVKPTEGGVYFTDGNYIVEIVKCKQFKTRAGEECFVADTLILVSDNPERKPGTLCSWYVKNIDDEETPAMGNVKTFMAIANGIDVNEVDEAGCEMVVSDENPLAGTILRVSASTTTTKHKKQPFTLVKWSAFEGTQEQADKFRKAARMVG